LFLPSADPFIQVFATGTQSVAGATIMTAILIVLAVFCGITNIATASRQLFAFARDQGVPFARFFAYVPPGWDIPLVSNQKTNFEDERSTFG
jgi:choline transport protein